MLKLSTRFSLARMIDKWREEHCQTNCPMSTLRYLDYNGLLDAKKVREFVLKEAEKHAP